MCAWSWATGRNCSWNTCLDIAEPSWISRIKEASRLKRLCYANDVCKEPVVAPRKAGESCSERHAARAAESYLSPCSRCCTERIEGEGGIDRRMWAMQYSRQERRVAVSVREETFFSLVVVRSSNLKGIVRVVNVVMKSHQGSLLRRRFAVAVVLQNVNAHKQQGGCGEWWEENYSKRVELILVEVKRTSWERTLYLDGS